MTDILQKIIAQKINEVSERRTRLPLSDLIPQLDDLPATRGFARAMQNHITAGRAAIIAEIKKASPSKGVIRADFDPAAIAKSYAEHGASCLSVLTDEAFFQGHDRYLETARTNCELPVIRKDFMIDPYQIYESRLIGADAILLIVAVLDDAQLHGLASVAGAIGLDILVEVHNEEELKRALQLPCQLVGINNRDLRTFETSLETTIELLPMIPDDRIVVTESGIHTTDDVTLMREHDVNAFLVGESFMRAPSPGEKMQSLFSL